MISVYVKMSISKLRKMIKSINFQKKREWKIENLGNVIFVASKMLILNESFIDYYFPNFQKIIVFLFEKKKNKSHYFYPQKSNSQKP